MGCASSTTVAAEEAPHATALDCGIPNSLSGKCSPICQPKSDYSALQPHDSTIATIEFPIESLPSCLLARILTFLTFKEVTKFRRLSRQYAEAGRMATTIKARALGLKRISFRKLRDNILEQENSVRRLLCRTYHETNRRMIRANPMPISVAVKYFPVIEGTEAYRNVECILDLPTLPSEFAWAVKNRFGRDYEIGIQIEPYPWLRLIVPIAQYIHETHMKLEELPRAMLEKRTEEAITHLLRAEIERLAALKLMRCTHAIVSRLCKLKDGNYAGSIFEGLMQDTELTLRERRTQLRDSRGRILDSPCNIDLRNTCLRIMVPSDELHDLYQSAHMITTQLMHQKMKGIQEV